MIASTVNRAFIVVLLQVEIILYVFRSFLFLVYMTRYKVSFVSKIFISE